MGAFSTFDDFKTFKDKYYSQIVTLLGNVKPYPGMRIPDVNGFKLFGDTEKDQLGTTALCSGCGSGDIGFKNLLVQASLPPLLDTLMYGLKRNIKGAIADIEPFEPRILYPNYRNQFSKNNVIGMLALQLALQDDDAPTFALLLDKTKDRNGAITLALKNVENFYITSAEEFKLNRLSIKSLQWLVEKSGYAVSPKGNEFHADEFNYMLSTLCKLRSEDAIPSMKYLMDLGKKAAEATGQQTAYSEALANALALTAPGKEVFKFDPITHAPQIEQPSRPSPKDIERPKFDALLPYALQADIDKALLVAIKIYSNDEHKGAPTLDALLPRASVQGKKGMAVALALALAQKEYVDKQKLQNWIHEAVQGIDEPEFNTSMLALAVKHHLASTARDFFTRTTDRAARADALKAAACGNDIHFWDTQILKSFLEETAGFSFGDLYQALHRVVEDHAQHIEECGDDKTGAVRDTKNEMARIDASPEEGYLKALELAALARAFYKNVWYKGQEDYDAVTPLAAAIYAKDKNRNIELISALRKAVSSGNIGEVTRLTAQITRPAFLNRHLGRGEKVTTLLHLAAQYQPKPQETADLPLQMASTLFTAGARPEMLHGQNPVTLLEEKFGGDARLMQMGSVKTAPASIDSEETVTFTRAELEKLLKETSERAIAAKKKPAPVNVKDIVTKGPKGRGARDSSSQQTPGI